MQEVAGWPSPWVLAYDAKASEPEPTRAEELPEATPEEIILEHMLSKPTKEMLGRF